MEQLAQKKKLEVDTDRQLVQLSRKSMKLRIPDNPESTLTTQLKQCKIALEEKRQVIKRCNEEILKQTNKDNLEDKITQADLFTEKVQRAIIDVTNAKAMKEIPVTPVTVPSTRYSPSPVFPPSTSVPPSTHPPTLHTSMSSTSTVSSPAHLPSLATTKVKLC